MKQFIIAAALVAAPASAEVASATPQGFELVERATVKAPPAEVYRTLVNIASWWDGAHSYSGDAANLSIDARPGGCWCEKLKDGGGIEHMRIVYAQPGAVLRAQGGLGPLQAEGVAGSLTYAIRPVAGGSEVTQTYVVGGYIRQGAEKLAPLVDAVMGAGFARLVTRVDGGSLPAAKTR
ncbi:MAG: SRPBCC family protein [Sphingomonadaceae bacterium]|nr:SRPBCC family protein [Sphingomonadaceae bacterium]